MTVRVALLVAVLSGCPIPVIPGNQTMGVYDFSASPLAGEPRCGLPDGGVMAFNGGFAFTATLSRDTDGGAAYVTLSGYPRTGTWDGQYLVSVSEAARVFEECSACSTRVRETFAVALLSSSQAQAVQLACPASPLDGGVPTSGEGITPPMGTPVGFDAILACGELSAVVELAADGGTCPEVCSRCSGRFALAGSRR